MSKGWNELGRSAPTISSLATGGDVFAGPADAYTGGNGGGGRRRENMVGVNLVLAEFVKFKHGLYKSCGIVF